MSRAPRHVALMLDLDWPYQRHLGVFAGTQRYADQHGWECTIDESADTTLSGHRGRPTYDGVIARVTSRLAQVAGKLGIPIVNAWANSPALERVPSVIPNDEAAGRLAAEHLMSRGLRQFGFLGIEDSYSSRRTFEGFRQTIRSVSTTCHRVTIPSLPTRTPQHWRTTERALGQWMDRWTPPIGILVASDLPSRLVAQMSHRRRWRVPEDVAIVAGSDEPIICEHPHPSLTSIRLGYERIGFEAASQLDAMMRKRRRRTPPRPKTYAPTLVAPQGLVIRHSTDFHAVDDHLVAEALRFIASHYHQPIKVQAVARAVGTGEQTLRNRFRKQLGRSITEEIRRVRVERVKRELVQSNRSLKEIAADVGLPNPQRLCEVFRREVGTSPGNYREQQT